MLGLCGSGRSGPGAQLFTRRFAGPRTRINIANDTQPLFGFRECREVTHVETKTLASRDSALRAQLETLTQGRPV
jgi:hypothetical protein